MSSLSLLGLTMTYLRDDVHDNIGAHSRKSKLDFPVPYPHNVYQVGTGVPAAADPVVGGDVVTVRATLAF